MTMTAPRSVTAAAGLAGLTAGLTALLWTVLDFPASLAPPPPPPPPGRPDGATPEEWDRVLAEVAAAPDPPPTSFWDLFVLAYDARLVALALTGVVLWLVVAVTAARGDGASRFIAVAPAIGQAVALPLTGTGADPEVFAVIGVVIVAGAASATLLFHPRSIAHFRATPGPASAVSR
ncbi:hypothetical protein [Nocardioides sp.]|uniref:hypothetical protein n=1 Tax=Nocardioides sp. TaxID=35761 RepID=UPI002C449248|nr:hypothetical protein [Nocardioides sp.]HXH80937.1 hypothetical protein [Nocardioides sp.]